jgi:exodeoxyribonuclease VII large subunit
MTLADPQVLTVTQLTKNIKRLLEEEFRFVRVSGEISNLKTPFSGHSYFTLKDQNSQLRVVFFKQQQRFSDLRLENGQEVICFGRIAVYEPRGDYQLIVDTVALFGLGRLQIAFEQLKNVLAAKGYFQEAIKKAVVSVPQKIILITSPTGAAVQDFLKIVRIREAPVHIQIIPVRVQGPEAANQISDAVALANTLADVDVIVLCRGGGSLEDLWAFNEEMVADAIHNSKIPVVTGIGHETDFTIADFCADFRCPTPTGAAEKIIYDARQLRSQLAGLKNRLNRFIERSLVQKQANLNYCQRTLAKSQAGFAQLSYRLELSITYLQQRMHDFLVQRTTAIDGLKNRLQQQSPSQQLRMQQQALSHLTQKLVTVMQLRLERAEKLWQSEAALLNSVSPLATLERGYAIARRYSPQKNEFEIIRRVAEVSVGDTLNVKLRDGEVEGVVSLCRESMPGQSEN